MVASQQVWEDHGSLGVPERKGHGQRREGQQTASGLRLPEKTMRRESNTAMERTGSQRGEV